MHEFAKLKMQAGSLRGSPEADRCLKTLAATVERLCENCIELQARIDELEKKRGTQDQETEAE